MAKGGRPQPLHGPGFVELERGGLPRSRIARLTILRPTIAEPITIQTDRRARKRPWVGPGGLTEVPTDSDLASFRESGIEFPGGVAMDLPTRYPHRLT